jgi:carboxymethylenebutenolidase
MGFAQGKSGINQIEIGSKVVSFYLALPTNSNCWKRAVVLAPEMFGATDHAREVARKFAREGFVAVLPQFFRPTDDEAMIPFESRKVIAEYGSAIADEAAITLVEGVAEWLTQSKYAVQGKVALVGFEAGGRLAHVLSAQGSTRFSAMVAFYGLATPSSEPLQHPTLFLVGEADPRISSDRLDALERELAHSSPTSRVKTFPSVGRGFFDPSRYRHVNKSVKSSCGSDDGYFDLGLVRLHDPSAAAEAWSETIGFLGLHLDG